MVEDYTGIKFKNVENKRIIPRHQDLNILKKWCGIFFEKEFAPPYPGGSSGNLSFRTKPNSNTFIITCSHTSLSNDMSNNDFSEVTECQPEQKTITSNGVKPPSSESFMHYMIYKNYPEINAVFHGHSEEIMNKAKNMNFPETVTELPYGTIELAKSTVNILKTGKFAILKNHGFISIGKSMKEAGQILLNL